MRYLIIGGSGSLGSLLARRLCHDNEVIITYFANPIKIENCVSYKTDLSETSDIITIMKKCLPEVVIHTAAPPNVDWHETHQDEAYRVNVITTKIIAEECRTIGAKLVYVSTSFVFPESRQVFSEDDIPAPNNFYGVTKLGGELATCTTPNHIIIRTDQIFGWTFGKKQSFVEKVLTSLARGEKVEACQDWYNSPTYVEDLANAMLVLISRDKSGLYHIIGDDFLNRVEWGTMIARIFGKDPSLIHPIQSSILNLPAKRPNVRLSNMKVKKELTIKLGTIEDRMRTMREVRSL